MENIPDLNNLIAAMECDGKYECENCPYGYQYWDDHYDYPSWACDENRMFYYALFYLKLYQHLINEEQNKNG